MEMLELLFRVLRERRVRLVLLLVYCSIHDISIRAHTIIRLVHYFKTPGLCVRSQLFTYYMTDDDELTIVKSQYGFERHPEYFFDFSSNTVTFLVSFRMLESCCLDDRNSSHRL